MCLTGLGSGQSSRERDALGLEQTGTNVAFCSAGDGAKVRMCPISFRIAVNRA